MAFTNLWDQTYEESDEFEEILLCTVTNEIESKQHVLPRLLALIMKSELITSTLLLTTFFASQAFAKPIFNDGGLGCGTIVSLRKSIQMPLPSELADEYGGVTRTTGGAVFQVLSAVPGVGILGAVAGDVATSIAVTPALNSNAEEAKKAKQTATQSYENVQAVEFRFDDGQVINIPVMVVNGMRYKVGARLNAMISPTYKNIALGNNILFASVPDIGDSDYNKACRIDNPDIRNAILESVKDAVDESRIVDPSERRVSVATPTPQ